jgi:iron complex transport system substrate-binding protein
MTVNRNKTNSGLFTVILILVAVVIAAGIYLRFSVERTVTEEPTDQGKPERIVSLSPNITEILFALGLGDQIVAVSNNCDYPPQTQKLQKVGSFFKPSVESIVVCNPDLVITLWFSQQQGIANTLERLDYTVLTFRLEEMGQLNPVIREIGKATGTEEAAQKLSARIESKLQAINEQCRDYPKTKVLWVLQTKPIRAVGTRTYMHELIELAGGQNVVGPTPQQYPQIGSESLLTCGAEVIIQSAMSKEDLPKQQQLAERFWGEYPEIPAIHDKRIYVIDSDTVLRLGPRIGEGLELIAGLLHDEYVNADNGEEN